MAESVVTPSLHLHPGLVSLPSRMFYDGGEPLIRTLIVGVLAYIFLVIVLRVSGKRTLSKMNAFDFIVTIALGSTLATMFVSKQVALAQGALGLALLVSLQWINTFIAARWRGYQRLLNAEPTLLVYRGEFLESAMLKQRVTKVEILAAARQRQITEPKDIDAVILETEGSLSVIGNGVANAQTLKQLGIDSVPTEDLEGESV